MHDRLPESAAVFLYPSASSVAVCCLNCVADLATSYLPLLYRQYLKARLVVSLARPRQGKLIRLPSSESIPSMHVRDQGSRDGR